MALFPGLDSRLVFVCLILRLLTVSEKAGLGSTSEYHVSVSSARLALMKLI